MTILHAPLGGYFVAPTGLTPPAWKLEVGDYTGTGVGGNDVPISMTAAWTPDWGFVRSTLSTNCFGRTRFHTTNRSDNLGGASSGISGLRSFDPGTFTVHGNYNTDTIFHVYCMWDEGDESDMMIREYVGTGVGSQTFPTPGGWEVESCTVLQDSGADWFCARAYSDFTAFRYSANDADNGSLNISLPGGGVTVSGFCNNDTMLYRLMAWKKTPGYHGTVVYNNASPNLDTSDDLLVDCQGNVPHLVIIQNIDNSRRAWYRCTGGPGTWGGHGAGSISSAPIAAWSVDYGDPIRIAAQFPNAVRLGSVLNDDVRNASNNFVLRWWSMP